MGERIGLIAGSGAFPIQAVGIARSLGYVCVVAGLRGQAEPGLKLKADVFDWFASDELLKLVTFFKSQDIREILLLGKADPRLLVRREGLGPDFAGILAQAKDRTSTSILSSLLAYLAAQGFSLKDPAFLYEPFFCPEGILTETLPGAKVSADMDFGWPLARAVADLDIGQTVVVKDGAIVAAEGMEGTDETIKRAGRLAGEGIVVIKVGRTEQDLRIDLPAVGLDTVRSLVKVRAAALCLEAQRMPFFQKDDALVLANANGIAVVARKA